MGMKFTDANGNRDVFGRACFFGSSLQLEKADGAYQLRPGTAYIEGMPLLCGRRNAVISGCKPICRANRRVRSAV